MDIINLKVGPPGVSVASVVFLIENVELVLMYFELHPLILVVETFDNLRECYEHIISRLIIVSVDRGLRPDDQEVVEYLPRTVDGDIALRGGRLDVIAFKVVKCHYLPFVGSAVLTDQYEDLVVIHKLEINDVNIAFKNPDVDLLQVLI